MTIPDTLLCMRNVERTPFGERLAAARKHAGLSQTELAKAVEMSQSALAEAEKTGQGSSFTSRIAARCAVNAHWLETGEGGMLYVTFPVPTSLTLKVSDGAEPPSEAPTNASPQEGDLVRAIELVAQAVGSAEPGVQAAFTSMFALLANPPARGGTTAQAVADLLSQSESAPAQDVPSKPSSSVRVTRLKGSNKEAGKSDGKSDRDADRGGQPDGDLQSGGPSGAR